MIVGVLSTWAAEAFETRSGIAGDARTVMSIQSIKKPGWWAVMQLAHDHQLGVQNSVKLVLSGVSHLHVAVKTDADPWAACVWLGDCEGGLFDKRRNYMELK